MVLSDNSKARSKDYGQISFVLVYLVLTTYLKFLLRVASISGYESISSYLNVGLIFAFSLAKVLSNKIVCRAEIFASLLILTSSFLFTFFTGGFMSGILAVGINCFLIYTSIVGNSICLTDWDILRLCKIIVAFAVLILAYAFYNVGPISNILTLENAYNYGFIGIWGSKNQFGRFLFCAAVCNFFILVYNKKNDVVKKFYYLTFCLISFSVVITFSRAALFALVVFLILYVLMTNKHNLKRNVVILFAVLLVGFALYKNDFVRTAVEDLVIRSETANLDCRSSLWKIGMDYFKSHIFIGSGEYRAAHILRASGSGISEFHNAYINRLVVSGIVVFFLYAYLYGKRFIVLFNESKRNEYATISLCLLVAIMSYMFFESFSLYTLSLDSYIIMIFVYLIPNLRLEK